MPPSAPTGTCGVTALSVRAFDRAGSRLGAEGGRRRALSRQVHRRLVKRGVTTFSSLGAWACF